MEKELKQRLIKSLEWVVSYLDWQNEQTGLEQEDSPSLKELKTLLEELKK
jgi:hypothetical protein